ncbi:MAG: glycine-rich domain-containing protein, partial [Candidatus Paceibacterota bacterium]
SFDSVVTAAGGTGGGGGTASYAAEGWPGIAGAAGSNGTASGGGTNTTGAGAGGGAGEPGGAGDLPGGNGGVGGNGGRSVKNYNEGSLATGSRISVVVGAGGVGGTGTSYGWGAMVGGRGSYGGGGNGSNGSVSITWTSAQTSPATTTPGSCNTNSALYGAAGKYTFTVPNGVTQIRVVAIGAGGGGGAGSGGWGSGGGGGCGGGLDAGTINVTPGQKIPLTVGYGGSGGNGSQQCSISGFPWCGSFYPSSNGSPGGDTGIADVVGKGGSWGRTGFYNLWNQYAGGTGGGSGGGGGGNGWPGFYGTAGNGGTAGGQTDNQGTGGYCTGDGWNVIPFSYYMSRATATPGTGGYAPGGWRYWGGGGGGGLVINNSTVNGQDGQSSPNNGGKGFGGGGGGSNIDNQGAGGAGASGAVYIEWNGGESNSCALSCSIKFDQNPLTGASTKIRWTSSNASLFYINNIGYVSGTGSAVISNPGDYSGTVSGIGSTATCPAVLLSENTCTTVSQSCKTNGNLVDNCGRATSCRYGCSTDTNECKTSQTCQSLNVCDATGQRVINLCDGSTVKDCTAQGLMCVAGACTLPSITFEAFGATRGTQAFTATGHLQASPFLVRPGETSNIYWNVTNAASCTVTGTNGDGSTGSTTGIWNTLFSGTSGKVSSGITSRTIYTLHCLSLQGATPAFVNETATVNLLPSFQEL